MIIKEKRGMTFNEIEIGQIVQHLAKRTVTEADNLLFTMLTLNTHPIHYDIEYAKNKLFKKILVNSCFTLSLVTGITVDYFSRNCIANLGWQNVKLPSPVFIGDTLMVYSEVVDKRISKTNSKRGIVTIKMTCKNQNQKTVLIGERSIMMEVE